MPRRFHTLRRGTLFIDDIPAVDVRIVRREGGAIHAVLGSGLGEACSSVEDAIVPLMAIAGGRLELTEDREPREGETPCPTCGVPGASLTRYPRALCGPCMLEATDPAGRALRFVSHASASGMRATYEETGEEYASVECWVRGMRCRAEAGYFGGIVLQPSQDA